MEYVPGVTLRSRLDDGRLDEREVRRLARQLSGALAEIHRHGLVHRDVTPKNVILDAAGDAKLIDLGFVTRIASGQRPDRIVGTFRYTAPEQAGILHRPLDGRTDLYALGVILFECVTGQVPFETDDPGELIYQHAVITAPSVQAVVPTASRTLSAIIAKLLAKDPDDRYPSAESLIADLDRFDALEAAAATEKPIPLGELERAPSNTHAPAMVGRQPELALLLEAWQRARSGSGQAVLIEGEAGAGKTRLAEEVIARALDAGAAELVLIGRAPKTAEVPFHPFREALETVIAGADSHLIDTIRTSAAELGPAAERLSPRLGALLQRSATETPPLSSPDALRELAVSFFLRLARERRGMILFIDDIDAYGDESRQLIHRLIRRVREAPLLFVGAARGVPTMFPDLGPADFSRIPLPPLDNDALEALLAESLGGQTADQAMIAHIADRSNGNPQVASEYLRAMFDAGVLCPSFGTWTIDRDELRELDLPKDLLELLLKRIASLSDGAQNVLAAAAVWGDSFEVQTLLRIADADIAIIHGAITEATGARLIERREGATYAFVHHRVEEAFLASIPPEVRAQFHEKSAELLSISSEESDASVYACARHWSAAGRCRYPFTAYRANLAAGRRALANFANTQARAFLERARQIAVEAGIAQDASLREALGEACARLGDMREGRVQFEAALRAAPTKLGRARLRVQLAELSLAAGEIESARHEADRAFAEIARRPRALRVLGRMHALGRGLTDRLKRRPSAARLPERLRVLAELYGLSARIADCECRPRDGLMLAERRVRIASVLGPSRELANALSAQAERLALSGRRREALASTKKARAIAERLDDRESFARGLLEYAAVREVLGDAREAENAYARALEEHGVWLKQQDFVRGCMDLAWNFLIRGHPRSALTWLERAGARTDAGAEPTAAVPALRDHGYAGAVLALLGRHSASLEQLELNPAREAEDAASQNIGRRLHHLANRLYAMVERQDDGATIDRALAEVDALAIEPERAPFRARHLYIAKAHGRVMQLAAATNAPMRDAREVRARKQEVEDALRALFRIARTPLFRAHAFLLRGLRDHALGDGDAALAAFSKAEEHARSVDCPDVLTRTAAARAEILLERGNSGAALREARIAHTIATEQGYAQRARELRAQFMLASQMVKVGMSSTDLSSVTMQRQRDALLQVSNASASATDPDEQTRMVLDQILKILHAERAFLFLTERGDQLELRAARNASGQDISKDGRYLKSVVETVRATRQPLVVPGAIVHQQPDASLEAVGEERPPRNVMAAPLMKGDRLVGIIYLDTRVARGIFSEDNLKILVAIANHVYITLEAMRTAQLEVYHRIAANIPGALYRVIVREDRTLDIPFISSGCRELFALDAEEIQLDAERLVGALHPEDRRSFLESLRASADLLGPWSWEGRCGEVERIRWIKIAGRPQRLTSGDTLVDGLLFDITERKRAEEALERAVEELARTGWRERERADALREAHARLVEANRRIKEEQSKLIHAEKLSSLGRLAAGVAHEINNPLTGVMACLEALESYNVPVERRDQYFETMKDGLDRMKSVVQSLLDFAAPHATQFNAVDVHALVHSTLRLIQPEIVRRRVQVNVRLRRGRTWVHGNRSQLMQAVMNVLLNAVHASAQSGEIWIGARTEGSRLGLEIRDQGAGIPEELITRICEPFFTTKPQGEGTGLGLAVTLGIIEAHDGELQIESQLGRGTTVTIWLRGETGPKDAPEEPHAIPKDGRAGA